MPNSGPDAKLWSSRTPERNKTTEVIFLAMAVDYKLVFVSVLKGSVLLQLLGFMLGWLTFYHQGHEVAKDFKPYLTDLQFRVQKVS